MITLPRVKARWRGIRPVIMHNARMADPADPMTIELKHLTKSAKGGRTVAVEEKISRLEWEGAMYWTPELGPYIPSDNIERCLQDGAAKKRLKKDCQAALLASLPSFRLEYEGPRDLDEMWESKRLMLRKSVVVSRRRIIRTRPMFSGWYLDVDVEYDPDVLDEKNVIEAMEDAGSLVGLGDWRPKFGRFTVEVL